MSFGTDADTEYLLYKFAKCIYLHATCTFLVRKQVSTLNEGRQSVHDGVRCGGTSLVLTDLVEDVNEKFPENGRFLTSCLSTRVSDSFEIITSRNGYKRL